MIQNILNASIISGAVGRFFAEKLCSHFLIENEKASQYNLILKPFCRQIELLFYKMKA